MVQRRLTKPASYTSCMRRLNDPGDVRATVSLAMRAYARSIIFGVGRSTLAIRVKCTIVPQAYFPFTKAPALCCCCVCVCVSARLLTSRLFIHFPYSLYIFFFPLCRDSMAIVGFVSRMYPSLQIYAQAAFCLRYASYFVTLQVTKYI